jgi:hypothetical protein
VQIKKLYSIVEEIRRQKEPKFTTCSRLLLIENVDKLVADICESFSRLSLVDHVTKSLHNICDVLDVHTLGQQSKSACFNVRTRGQDAIHVLEIRKRTPDKQHGP